MERKASIIAWAEIEAILGLLGERLEQDRLDRLGQSRIEAARRRQRPVEVRERHRDGRSASNGTRPVSIWYSTTPSE